MKIHVIKKAIIDISLKTPIISLLLIVSTFYIAWLIASNSYVSNYTTIDATIINLEDTTKLQVTTELENDILSNIINAELYYVGENKYSCLFDYNYIENGKNYIVFSTVTYPQNILDNMQIKVEYVSEKISLAERIMESLKWK